MKRIALLVIVILAASTTFAQTRNQLMGPAAKNYHPTQNTEESTLVVTLEEPGQLMGPEAKNYSPNQDVANQATQQVELRTTRPRLIGPAAKNYKIGRRNQPQEVQPIIQPVEEPGPNQPETPRDSLEK